MLDKIIPILLFTLLLAGCEKETVYFGGVPNPEKIEKTQIDTTNYMAMYREPGHILAQKVYYTDNQSLIRVETFDTINGVLTNITTTDNVIDEHACIKHSVCFDHKNRFTSQIFYNNQYNSDGKLISSHSLYDDHYFVDIKYNSDGNIASAFYSRDESFLYKFVFSYSENGDTVIKDWHYSDTSTPRYRYKYSYNPDNILTQREYYYLISGDYTDKEVFNYSDNNIFGTSILLYYHGNIYGGKTLNYDSFGRVTYYSSSTDEEYYTYQYSNDDFVPRKYYSMYSYIDNYLLGYPELY